MNTLHVNSRRAAAMRNYPISMNLLLKWMDFLSCFVVENWIEIYISIWTYVGNVFRFRGMEWWTRVKDLQVWRFVECRNVHINNDRIETLFHSAITKLRLRLLYYFALASFQMVMFSLKNMMLLSLFCSPTTFRSGYGLLSCSNVFGLPCGCDRPKIKKLEEHWIL